MIFFPLYTLKLLFSIWVLFSAPPLLIPLPLPPSLSILSSAALGVSGEITFLPFPASHVTPTTTLASQPPTHPFLPTRSLWVIKISNFTVFFFIIDTTDTTSELPVLERAHTSSSVNAQICFKMNAYTEQLNLQCLNVPSHTLQPHCSVACAGTHTLAARQNIYVFKASLCTYVVPAHRGTYSRVQNERKRRRLETVSFLLRRSSDKSRFSRPSCCFSSPRTDTRQRQGLSCVPPPQQSLYGNQKHSPGKLNIARVSHHLCSTSFRLSGSFNSPTSFWDFPAPYFLSLICSDGRSVQNCPEFHGHSYQRRIHWNLIKLS